MRNGRISSWPISAPDGMSRWSPRISTRGAPPRLCPRMKLPVTGCCRRILRRCASGSTAAWLRTWVACRIGWRKPTATITAAVWGLDYLYWWAEHGAAGINFHTGDGVSVGNQLHVPAYGVFTTRPDGYEIRPLAYALKAFSLAGHGPLLPAVVQAPPEANLSAYAVRSNDRLTVTVINRTHDKDARDLAVALKPGSEWTAAEAVFLRDADGVAAVSGVTLGEVPIDVHG